MVPLVCGDPQDEKDAVGKSEGKGGKGASYTCFLFPFAYQPIGDPHPDRDELCYVPLRTGAAEWQRRRRYFTRETADVLFDRALWLGIARDNWEQPREGLQYPHRFTSTLHSGEVEVQLAPPELILLEWRSDLAKGSTPDPFQTGFLLLQAHFPADQTISPTLDDLMLFNERFRFWRPLFVGHADLLRPVAGLLSHF